MVTRGLNNPIDPLATCDTVRLEDGLYECHTDNLCRSFVIVEGKKLCKPLSHALPDEGDTAEPAK